METTEIRGVAQRAVYTPGAIYSYVASKEDLYGALLGESLDRLNDRVQQARDTASPGSSALRATATAFFDFYRENPRDLDLGFYLFQGMQPRGLTPDLNDTLNVQLRNALQPTQDALLLLGMPAKQALEEVTALFAHTVGQIGRAHV